MPPTIQAAGLATIKVNTGASSALEVLGLTVDGVQISSQEYTGPVYCDDHGGEQGPPADIQDFGATHSIRLLFSKFDPTIAAKVQVQKGGTDGTPGDVGALLFQGNKFYRLVIDTPNSPRNYPRVVFTEPQEINKGTKYSQWLLVGTAYENAEGVLYNSTTA